MSKRLSYLLRHGALKEGLHIKPDGFVPVTELLRKLPNYTLEDIKKVVELDPKNRYTLSSNSGVTEIKANQGHTIVEVNELKLTPLTNPDFEIVHGTYFSNWTKIKTEGLSRMKRNHIHFAKGINFICGLRKSAQVFIFIDFNKATADGISFFVSENNVVLSRGNEKGLIEPKYFSRVVDKQGKVLFKSED